MSADHTLGPSRPRLRARVVARLRAQAGDTLIEVLVAALLVALIATASLAGYGTVAHIAGTQRNEAQAATLAQQDEARLRGLTINQLSGSLGNNGSTNGVSTVIGGTTYKVVSKSQFISGSSGLSSCSTGSTTAADVVQTTSTVTWTPNNDGRAPVIVHGLITPAQGGSLIVSATDQSGAGLAGLTATITGPSSVTPLTTDAGGCAVFAGLAGGTYTATYSAPGGYVDKNGNAPASWSGPVTNTQTATATPLVLGQAGVISATFTTFFNGSAHPATADTFVATNSNAGIAPRVFGTDSTPINNAFASTVTSPTSPPTVYPFTNPYSVYAGTCAANQWATTPPAIPTALVTPGATVSPSAPIPEPAMIVEVYGYDYDDTNSAIGYSGTWLRVTGNSSDYNGTETTSIVTGSTATVSFTGTSVSWIGSTGPGQGQATVTIDGGSPTTVDTYSSSTQYQQVFTRSGLSNSAHTLTIAVAGTKNSRSSGYLISIDAFNLPNVAAALYPTVPDVTVTETDSGCGNNEDYPPSQIPTLAQGALVSPGEPYGTYTVCADNGLNHNIVTGVVNTSFTTGNTVNINLGTGSAGLASGPCP